MSEITAGWDKKIIVLPSQLYLSVFFFITIFEIGAEIQLDAALQGVVVFLLLAWRLSKIEGLFFIPDIFLFSLPNLWLLSLYETINNWTQIWIIPFLVVFAISTLYCLKNKILRKVNKQIVYGLWIAVVFVILMAFVLRIVFPPFTQQLFNRTLLNSIACFASFPICLTAFHFKIGKE